MRQFSKRNFGRVLSYVVKFGQNVWPKPGGDKVPHRIFVGTLRQQRPAVEDLTVRDFLTERLWPTKTRKGTMSAHMPFYCRNKVHNWIRKDSLG
jgi:hypothetical protein